MVGAVGETQLSHEAREIVSIAEPQVGSIFGKGKVFGSGVVECGFQFQLSSCIFLQVQETLQQFRSLSVPEMEVKKGFRLTRNLTTNVVPESNASVRKHMVKDGWILHHHVSLRLSILIFAELIEYDPFPPDGCHMTCRFAGEVTITNAMNLGPSTNSEALLQRCETPANSIFWNILRI